MKTDADPGLDLLYVIKEKILKDILLGNEFFFFKLSVLQCLILAIPS